MTHANLIRAARWAFLYHSAGHDRKAAADQALRENGLTLANWPRVRLMLLALFGKSSSMARYYPVLPREE